MILELDCGNSFIKWRLLSAEKGVGPVGVAANVDDMVSEILNDDGVKVARCRMVSVRSIHETKLIADGVSRALGVRVAQAGSSECLAGVRNGYRDYDRLGLDRWLALVAAFNLCGHACLVVDVGTAVTVDLVASDGKHLGGYIAPGIALLRGQLLSHTRRIRYDSEEAGLALSDIAPGRSTAEAVERGCLLMLRGYVSNQLLQAHDYLKDDFATYVTGGDALLVADLPSVTYVSDLVFRGLALACP